MRQRDRQTTDRQSEREKERECETHREKKREGEAACDGDEEVSHMRRALKMPREEKTAGILAKQNKTKSALLSLCCANITYNIRRHKDKCDRKSCCSLVKAAKFK